MKLHITIPFLVLVLGVLSHCSTPKATSKASEAQLQRLMSGSYLSKAQSERDTDYYNISLKMVPIWKGKSGTWLYVEQAMAAKLDKPYRQRIYKLVALPDGRFESIVYQLKNEKDAVGKGATSAWFDQFKPDDILDLRPGCSVILKKINATTYEGSTDGKSCISTLRGAAYATSIVRLESDKIVSWDQGFDEQGKQVWGATKGGYIFDKQ